MDTQRVARVVTVLAVAFVEVALFAAVIATALGPLGSFASTGADASPRPGSPVPMATAEQR